MVACCRCWCRCFWYVSNEQDRIDRIGADLAGKASDAFRAARDFVMQSKRSKKTPEQVKAEIEAREAAARANRTPSKRERQEAERRAAREQQSQTPTPSRARTQNQPTPGEKPPASSSSSTPAPAPTPTPTPTPQPPQPPQPPKGPGVLTKIGDKFNKALKKVDKWNKNLPDPSKTIDWNKVAQTTLSGAGNVLSGAKTAATGLKNVVLGKTRAGFGTRVVGSGVADQVGLSGAIGTKINRAIQSNLQKGRAWGEDEKAQDREQGAKEREEFRRRRENQNKPLNPSKYYTGDL